MEVPYNTDVPTLDMATQAKLGTLNYKIRKKYSVIFILLDNIIN